MGSGDSVNESKAVLTIRCLYVRGHAISYACLYNWLQPYIFAQIHLKVVINHKCLYRSKSIEMQKVGYNFS